MIYLGIDPSAINRTSYGAITLLDETGTLLSVIRLDQPLVDIIDQIKSYTSGTGSIAVIEKVWAMKGQAASGAFHFGTGYGCLQTICTMLDIRYSLVTPQKWQKHFGLKREKGLSKVLWKTQLAEAARALHPDTKLVKPVCDSVLLAHYCLQKHQEKQ